MAAAAVLGVCLMASGAQAQQKQQQQPAQQQPAKPQPQAAQGGQQQPAESKSSWVKLCETPTVVHEGKKETKKVCLTHHERLDGNTGMVLVSAAIRKIEGEDKERLMVMVPLGMAIPPGLQARIDDEPPIPLRFTICHTAGCTAETDATKEIIEKLKKGKRLVVAALNFAGKALGFPVPLEGFTKAYQGEPIDSKKYAEARRELMQLIRKRQIELAKKAAEAQKEQKEQNGTAQPQQQKK